MTDPTTALVIAVIAVPLAAAALSPLMPSAGAVDRLNVVAAILTSATALALAAVALLDAPGVASATSWYLLDTQGGLFLALIGIVGLGSAITSRAYLRHAGRGLFGARHSRVLYFVAFNVFWAALLARAADRQPRDRLGSVEGTTAASALLVGFSGRRSALEASWKYLILTTLGLTVTLLGIVVLFARAGEPAGLGDLDWQALAAAVAPGVDRDVTLAAFLLIVVGLASKVGWAPVHNWLPDAHSEAPPPISAMLSAALLPTVLLVVWRTAQALEGSLASGTAQTLLIGFGLASLAVAVPFLWTPLPFKRLLAYSSLEHMGVLALGIGFGTPLAIAGVAIHVIGHGLAKAVGFYAAIPLLREDPAAGEATGARDRRSSPGTAFSFGVSLSTLAALPPLPLFVSELMILLGGIEAGLLWVSAVAALLLALGFLGLAHALIEGLVGDRRRGRGAPLATRPRDRLRRRRRPLRPARAQPHRLRPSRLGHRRGTEGRGDMSARRAGALRRPPSSRRSCPEPGGRAARRCSPRAAGSCGAYSTRAGEALEWTALFANGLVGPGASHRCPLRRSTRSSTSCRRPTGTSARHTTCTESDSRGDTSTRALLDHSAELGSWTVPIAGRRRRPGRGRPDPRRRDRVRPLPLPRRRRADPARRPAALLQASRARSRRLRPRASPRHSGTRSAPAPPAR